MIRHVFTLMWNRRRANALLVLEIFLAYVVLFAVGTTGTSLWLNYRQPLGFRYDDVWEVNFSTGTQPKAERYGTFEQVLARLRATPGVRAVAATSSNTPFSFNDSRISKDEGALRDINFYLVGPELRDVMGLELTAGRWFDQRDATPGPHAPLVVTEQLQRALYPGGESAVGKLAELNGKEKQRIIGVVSAYRTDGELKKVLPGMFGPLMPADSATHDARTLLVRVAPGSGAALEKRLADDIRRIGPGWSSTIRPLREMHSSQLKQVMTRPLLLGVMSFFLLVNVALGLFGVLWLAISARRAELGVRRALGATAGSVSRLIVGETLALTTFGLVLGLLVAVQFPLLGAFGERTSVYLTAIALATGALYLLAVVCALYPSQLAARIRPAVALREE